MENNPSIVSNALYQASPTKEPEYNSFGKNDYVINGEITVTITLAEYRQLLTAHAKAEAQEANSKVYGLRQEIETLKKELTAANKQIDEFRALIQSATAKKEDTSNA